MYVRVVHRIGWDVEVVGEGGAVQTTNLPDREQALQHARRLEPSWIELGEVVAATPETPQHHRWKTLRRRADGAYEESTLSWGGRG